MRLLGFALVMMLVAGCANGPGGQVASQDGSLAINGTGAKDLSSSKSCGGTAQLSVGGNVGSGSTTVSVTDGAGKQTYSKTIDGPGQAGDNKSLTGAPGTWTIRASTTSSFSGQVGATLEC